MQDQWKKELAQSGLPSKRKVPNTIRKLDQVYWVKVRYSYYDWTGDLLRIFNPEIYSPMKFIHSEKYSLLKNIPPEKYLFLKNIHP